MVAAEVLQVREVAMAEEGLDPCRVLRLVVDMLVEQVDELARWRWSELRPRGIVLRLQEKKLVRSEMEESSLATPESLALTQKKSKKAEQ